MQCMTHGIINSSNNIKQIQCVKGAFMDLTALNHADTVRQERSVTN